MDRKISTEKYWIIIILLIAAVWRLGHFVMWHTYPVANVPVLDSLSYHTMAKAIAMGPGLPDQVYFQAPFYPYFLAVFYKFSNCNMDLIRLVQIVLDIISVLLVFVITKTLFSSRSAIVAGLGMALYPVTIFHTGLILKTTLNVFWSALQLALILVPSKKYPVVRLLLIGLVTGFAAATQGSALLQIPLIYLWVLIDAKPRNWRAWIPRMMMITLGLMVSIGPFTYRNYHVSGRFVLLTAQGGANFYLGNSPYSDGTSKRPPHVRMTPEHEEADFHREAEHASGRKLTPEEASSYWTQQAVKWIRENPGDALKLQLRKLGLFWNFVEIPDNYDFDFSRKYSFFIRYPRYPFRILGVLALSGMVFLLPAWRKTWFLTIWTLSYSAVWIIFHIYSRYRLPVVVFLWPFAGAFVDWFMYQVKKQQSKQLVTSILFMVITGLLISLPLTGYTYAQPYFNLGKALSEIDQTEKAEEAYMKSLAINSDYVPSMVNLGKLEYARGDVQKAKTWWMRALETDDNSAEAHLNLGTLLARDGNVSEALYHYVRSTEIQPYYHLAWLHLAQAQQFLEEYEDALATYQHALELQPDHPQTLYGVASSMLTINHPEARQAWMDYLEIAENDPVEKKYVPVAKKIIRQLSSVNKFSNNR